MQIRLHQVDEFGVAIFLLHGGNTVDKTKPDICTSSICHPPNNHCKECSHAIFTGTLHVNGKRWPFEFRPVYGVTFMKTTGDPKKVQPSETHPVWEEWQEWQDAKFK